MRLHEYRKAHVALRHGPVIERVSFERFKRKLRVRRLFVVLLRRLPLIKNRRYQGVTPLKKD
jgi:hypothetical protein